MNALWKKCFAVFLSVATIAHTLPTPILAHENFTYGKPTAEEAAAPGLASTRALDGLGMSSAGADTTDYEFPEDEAKKHVWRDVALWLVVAGFVAYFVIKVFLQEEPEDPPADKPGKDPPPTSLTAPRQASFLRPSP